MASPNLGTSVSLGLSKVTFSFWYIDCYAAPWFVSLYEVRGDRAARQLWSVESVVLDPRHFPGRLRAGTTPEGYDLTSRLWRSPPQDALLEVGFGRGEAYYEESRFRMTDIPIGSVLTFDGQELRPGEFRSQPCSDE
jgi:hypothetical protein